MASTRSGNRRLYDDDERPAPHPPKRSKRILESESEKDPQQNKKLAYNDYTVGWVAALHIERAAAFAILDEIYENLPKKPGDTNNYTFGRIGDHNTVIASLPDDGYGTINAATVASNMHRTFPSLEVFLMVGIAGGAPGSADVRLGDVVVSRKLVQYDLGNALGEDCFQITAIPYRPSQELRNAVSALRSRHERELSRIPDLLCQMAEKNPHMGEYTSRDSEDLLFESTYEHPESEPTCNKCDRSRLVQRTQRPNNHPVIHYGVVASGDQVIKYAKKRDELAQQFNALCFEMEGAGFIESLQCLVIRSICDYADSHKNKQWQRYAAATAAAYTKELLGVLAALKAQEPQSVIWEQHKEKIDVLMNSLCFETIIARELSIKPAYGKTCTWILHHPDYSAWLDPDRYPQNHGFLWIRGKPAVGKSTLMKFIYSKLKKDYNVISFFFNARGDDLGKSIEGMFRSLLFQLLREFSDLRQVLVQPHLFLKTSRKPINWDIDTLQDLFLVAVEKLGRRQLICVVDALDECNEDEVCDLVEYFEHLGESASKKDVKLFTCLSSRHYPSITIKASLALTLEDQRDHDKDLEEYTDHKLDVGKGQQALEIRRDLLEKASGIFMWVVLVVGILNKEYQRGRIFAVRKRLGEIPAKLSELFRNILKRDDENVEELLLSIQWILYAKYPLRPEEYYYAMISGLDPDEKSLDVWDREQITIEHMKRFVSSSSKGLAEVVGPLSFGTVQFIHESVRDFLLKDGGIYELGPDLETSFESWSHNRLKECCSTYIQRRELDINHLRKGDTDKPLENRFPFIRYASRHVMVHCEKAATSFPQDRFLNSFDYQPWIHILTFEDRLSHEGDSELCLNLIRLLTVQNCALARFPGSENARFLSSKPNRDDKEGSDSLERSKEFTLDSDYCVTLLPHKLESSVISGKPLLHWAVEWKSLRPSIIGEMSLWNTPLWHIKFIELLLDRGAEINTKDQNGQTPLSWAYQRNPNYQVIQLLLNRGAKIDTRDQNSQKLLYWAFEKGYDYEFINLLLDRGARVNTQDLNGQTPLFWACQKDLDYEVIKLLLDRGAEINTNDYNGQTPLSWACQKDPNYEVIQLLLDRGAEINTNDHNGQTPLSWACRESYDSKVIEILVNRGAEVNTNDQNRQTPLSWACKVPNSLKIAKILLNKGAGIDTKDQNGQTPLSWACQEPCSSKIIEILLDGGAEINTRDRNGQTPLYWAYQAHNCSGVIELLLNRGAKIHTEDVKG